MKRQRENDEELDDKLGDLTSARAAKQKEPISHISLPAELPTEVWRLIGLKLDARSRTRLRAVCKSWVSLLPQPPWLMLAQSEDGQESEDDSEAIPADYYDETSSDSEDSVSDAESEEDQESEGEQESEEEQKPIIETQQDDSPAPKNLESPVVEEAIQVPPPPRGFVSLGDQQIYHIDFPQLHRAQCVGSTGNWLITAHKDRGRTIRLLNPFSKQQCYLPPQWAFEHKVYDTPDENLRYLYLWKVILSSPPTNGGGCIAMAIHNCHHSLALAKLGDEKWTTVGAINVFVEDIIFYKGYFYAISHSGMLFVCDIGNDMIPPTISRLSEGLQTNMVRGVHFSLDDGDDSNIGHSEYSYLVEWLGELLMVIRFIDIIEGVTYKTIKFEVHKFDFIKKKWNVLRSLGEHSLFVGFNTSVSLHASKYFGSMKKNCVYFTDDFVVGYREGLIAGGHDMGVFNLADNTITPHFNGVSTCFYSPPVWIIPT